QIRLLKSEPQHALLDLDHARRLISTHSPERLREICEIDIHRGYTLNALSLNERAHAAFEFAQDQLAPQDPLQTLAKLGAVVIAMNQYNFELAEELLPLVPSAPESLYVQTCLYVVTKQFQKAQESF